MRELPDFNRREERLLGAVEHFNAVVPRVRNVDQTARLIHQTSAIPRPARL